jgi:hypothetical protein
MSGGAIGDKIQIGQSADPLKNFTLHRPDAEDGSLLLSRGNMEAEGDLILKVNPDNSVTMDLDLGRTAPIAASGQVGDIYIPGKSKRITVLVSELSTNGTSVPIIQLGTLLGVENSGYIGSASTISGDTTTTNHATGFLFSGSPVLVTSTFSGAVTLSKIDNSNTWVCSGVLGLSNGPATIVTAGAKQLGGDLSTVRLTTVSGTEAFDNGKISVIYE